MNARIARAYRTARRFVEWREEYTRLARLRGVHPNVIADTIGRHRAYQTGLENRITRELELRDLERRGIVVRP